MTRLHDAAIVLSLAFSLPLCNAVSQAQGIEKRAGQQSSEMLVVARIAHLRNGFDLWPKIIAPRTLSVARANAIISEMSRRAAEALRDCDNTYRLNFDLPDSKQIGTEESR